MYMRIELIPALGFVILINIACYLWGYADGSSIRRREEKENNESDKNKK